MKIHNSVIQVEGHNVFYREAGNKNNPAILLLHGFPSSSHQFRNLIPILSKDYYIVAPDLPGYGFTTSPNGFRYTFENLTQVIDKFTNLIGLKNYAIYVFDYGAPVGFRLALLHPDKIKAIISQSGNAYEEGLGEFWDPLKKYWQEDSPPNREALRKLLSYEATKWQYTKGAPDESLVPPESYTLDALLMERPGNKEIQLDLFKDYGSNVKLYPKFHDYFKEYQPPILAIWGKNDPIFIFPGAEAFKKDNPTAKVKLINAGHFALESSVDEIGQEILDFLAHIPQTVSH